MAMINADQALVDSLLEEIQTIASDSTAILEDDEKRGALLQASRRLTAALQQPDEVTSDLAFTPYAAMCALVAADAKLFHALAESSAPMSAEQLAEKCGVEKDLVDRFLRILSGYGVVAETGKSTYTTTSVTRLLTMEAPHCGMRHFCNVGFPILHKMPEYFRSNGYRLPKSTEEGALQFAHGTSLDAYQFMHSIPGCMENFHTFMKGLLGTPGRAYWGDLYDVKKFIFDQYDTTISDVVFVDVGGGNGHESLKLKQRMPDIKGKFIVQDLPEVVEEFSDPAKPVEYVAHDFTTPQPVKHAKAYFMQHILHNWPDAGCLTILRHLAAAMHPEYSRLLIAEIILPDQNCPRRQAGFDIAMLVLHNGSQRTEAQWVALLDQAGLEVVKFWHPTSDGDGLVEAKLKSAA